MAASEALLPWGGLQYWNRWSGAEEEEEESYMETQLKAQLQAMTLAAQAKDLALQDLQRRLQAALEEIEQWRAKGATLLRRAEIAEAAEEALASQMGELEAEAYASITHSNKTQHRALQAGAEVPWLGNTEEPAAIGEKQRIERGMRVAREGVDYWERRCIALEAEVELGKAREAALLKRAEKAEAAEESLAAEMAEVEAEAYERITGQHNKVEYEKATVNSESDGVLPERNSEILELIGNRHVAELERRLAEAERALEEIRAKLEQAEEEKVRLLEKGDAKKVMKVKKNEGKGSEEALLSLSLQELGGVVKLRLWSPSSLTLASA